jgi:hypothetical protein
VFSLFEINSGKEKKMKKLKALLNALAISFGLAAMPLSAATTVVNVPVVHGAWTFIGVPGFQSYGATSGTTTLTWPNTVSTSSPMIIDASGEVSTTYQVAGLEVPTWDGNFSGQKSETTAASGTVDTDGTTPRPAYNGAGVGSDIYGTVAVMALGQDTTDALSSTTDHNGAVIVALAGWNEQVKDFTSPIRTLYIQSPNAAYPDIKVLYQARLEGDNFLIQYETGTATALTTTDNVTYQGTFSRAYTYDNAAVLGTDFAVYSATTTGGTAGTDVDGILASFDMNLTDNNMSSSKGDIEPSTVAGSLREILDGNMTVLAWDAATQQWRQFRATGTGSTATETTANDFSTFTQGQGYWVKVDKDGGADYNYPSGFVLGYDSAADINHSSFIADGWNMLSFGDEYLSYSTTGMVVNVAADVELNVTDTYGAETLSIPLLAANSEEANCLVFNKAVDQNNSFAYSNFQVKCIPNPTVAGDVVLLSTRRFTVQSNVAPTAIDGSGALTAESNGSQLNFYKSQYGTHAIIIEPNTYFQPVAGIEGNMSVEFPADTVGAVYSAVTTVAATDGFLTTALDTASANLTGFQNDVLPLDMNYDGTEDALLVSSNYRFFLKDATLVRVFNYDETRADTTRDNTGSANNWSEDNNVTMRVVGKAVTTATNADFVFVDDNYTIALQNIENIAPFTDVNSTALVNSADDNTTFMIFYTGKWTTDAARVGTIDIQEWGDSWDLLTEIDASADNNYTSEGAIAKVWHISNIVNYTEDANASGYFDGNYSYTARAYTSDLRYNAVFAESYPVEGPLYDIVTGYGKRAELMITGQTEADTTTGTTFISWKQIDASVPPAEWYDTDNQFELFWTEKEKGYWVYLNDASTNDLSFDTPALTGSTYAHFNNYFSGTSSTSTTRNHLNHTLTLTANNLTAVGVAASNTDSYEVYANIGGYKTSFQRVSSTNGFSIPINSHETPGLSFDAGEVAIDITAADASGKTVSTTYTLDYSKPVITSVAISGATATVAVTNGTSAASDIDVYSGDINDSDYGTSTSTNWAGTTTVAGDTTDVNLGTMNGLSFPTAFDYNATAYLDGANWYDTLARQLREGLIKDVRFTAKDTANNTTLYSDQYRLYYIPVYSGTGILSDDGTDTVYDSNPLVYTTGGVADADYSGATGGLDDGVQLKSVVSGTTISCVYAHQDNVTLNEAVANVKTLQTASGTDVGIIMYMDEYIGQPFMCEVDGNVYIGGFVDADSYLTDITMQSLSTSVTTSIVKQ